MKRILQNTVIALVCVFLFAGLFLYNRSEFVEAESQYATSITVRNTTPFELKDVQLQFNNTEPVTVESVQSGEKVIVDIPENARPAVTIRIKGDTDTVGSFANYFSGRIASGSEVSVYLDEDMKLGVSSNIEE